MGNLEQWLNRFADLRIVVFGDLVADMFVYGEVSRISREAPVLILNHRETQVVPGGGANAAHNLFALGAKPVPVGIVGEDAEGDAMLGYFRKLGIDTSAILRVKGYRTPTKTRILAGAVHAYRHQIVRIDAGEPLREPAVLASVARTLRAAVAKSAAVLVSDYGYGLATPDLVNSIRSNSRPSIIDSRFAIQSFQGMTAATPNEPEVEETLGIQIGNDPDHLESAGRTLLGRLKHKALLVTRGKEGMALFEPRKKTVHIPIFGNDEVADVTGAGDTVIATFTLGLAAGAPFTDAAHLSNVAAGLVVMKYGTRTVGIEELRRAVRESGR